MHDEKTVALILAQLEDGDSLTIGIGGEPEVELSPEEQLHAVAGELVEAVRCADVKAVAEALRGAFLLLDSMPHVEGAHIGEQAEEAEGEEYGHAEPVSHELAEQFGGLTEDDEEAEGYAYGGMARKGYAYGGMAGPRMTPGLTGTGASFGPMSPFKGTGSQMGPPKRSLPPRRYAEGGTVEQQLEKRRAMAVDGFAAKLAAMRAGR